MSATVMSATVMSATVTSPTMTPATGAAPPRRPRRARRHGVVLEPADRRALERAGWRTTLEYREDQVRGRDGRLVEVRRAWVAEAERYTGPVRFATAAAPSVDAAWAQLRADLGVA